MRNLPSRASILLLCALPMTGCGSSAFIAPRDPAPASLKTIPPRPEIAPENPTDVDLAAERLRFGAAIVALENIIKGWIKWDDGR